VDEPSDVKEEFHIFKLSKYTKYCVTPRKRIWSGNSM